MKTPAQKSREFEELVVNFVFGFESVFNSDWEFTKGWMNDPQMINPKGSFIYPEPADGDESNNWANRGSLLDTYHRLRAMMEEMRIDPTMKPVTIDDRLDAIEENLAELMKGKTAKDGTT